MRLFAALAMAGFTPGGRNRFDWTDFLLCNTLLLRGIFMALFACGVWGAGNLSQALAHWGKLRNAARADAVFFVARWASPMLILELMLKAAGVVFAIVKMDRYSMHRVLF